ncbi:RNA polymerase sigma factor [Planococcus lenghuensis]|uniref:RNA polymerase subunit sigma-70 n=1 Tax=Planococcus lenghuensis TaxID=2213202 RepID=A0A1Q2KYK6_9BACL|nr:sigma-70 family RNA polymerase sigma factor [Planococcus lenghuensis]AQQ53281.1 RNA polymerase subunit sigma-70 [Planococcus lenghuensis]
MERVSDTQLYQRIQAQDREALEQLYDRYEKILFSFLVKMTADPNLAEEAMQEVFIKIWRGVGKYDESKGKFTSWLFTMSRNAAIDLIRKRKQGQVSIEESGELISHEPLMDEKIEWKEKKKSIETAVRSLSKEQQQMIQLFYFKGYTHEKIAESCGLPLGTVKSRIRLALVKLKKTLGHLQEGRAAHEESGL